jgi:hypothetical protein
MAEHVNASKKANEWSGSPKGRLGVLDHFARPKIKNHPSHSLDIENESPPIHTFDINPFQIKNGIPARQGIRRSADQSKTKEKKKKPKNSSFGVSLARETRR